MKRVFRLQIILLITLAACTSNEDKSSAEKSAEIKIHEEVVNYKVDSLTMNSYVAYDENKKGPRPAVLVVHEWWGLNDYIKSRAKQLAELGYIAMAVDMYGNGRMGNDVQSASALAMPFYTNPAMAKKHFDAALENFKKNENVDATKVAAMGYCFGGSVVLGMAKMGEDLKGVVSFHGGLAGMTPDKNLLKAEMLVCHGGNDSFVPDAEVNQFKKQMDSVGAKYTFIVYPGAQHAFTNPQADEWGKKFNIPVSYNGAADTASWKEMKNFFERVLK
jgi:dienelactone hydrolase